MLIRRIMPVFMAVCLLFGVSHAGSYSSGYEGIDSIAGYVGPAGDGITATDENGNYVNPVFVGWATGIVDYSPSDSTGAYGYDTIGNGFEVAENSLGEVTGDNFHIVSLGDLDSDEVAAGKSAGSVTLSFDVTIANGAGADLAVFENAFVSEYTTGAGSNAGEVFAELAYVEVSTDGVYWVRFPSIYENDAPTGNTAYLTQDVSNVYNLAGKSVNAYGESWATAFDLEDLVCEQQVIDGYVDLDNINFVRIVDIAGDGSCTDSSGNSIYDAWVTWGSGGFDLEAIGVINVASSDSTAVPEPSSIVLLGLGSMLLFGYRRSKS